MNVMIDRGYRARLIDFGSVGRYHNSAPFEPVDTKVRCTEGYYLPYHEMKQQLPSLANKISFEDYYCHSNFDVYSFGVILKNYFFLKSIVGESHFLRNHLQFLSEKCMDIDPDRRWPISQVITYLRHIIDYFIAQSHFWRAKGIKLKGYSSSDWEIRIQPPLNEEVSFDKLKQSI